MDIPRSPTGSGYTVSFGDGLRRVYKTRLRADTERKIIRILREYPRDAEKDSG